jgi:hypothetical protein
MVREFAAAIWMVGEWADSLVQLLDRISDRIAVKTEKPRNGAFLNKIVCASYSSSRLYWAIRRSASCWNRWVLFPFTISSISLALSMSPAIA